MDERGGHGAIDTAGEAEEHALLAHGGADGLHGVLDVVLGGPVLARAADAEEEVADHVDAALGVEDLGVKLDAVEVALLVLDDGELGVFRGADGGVAGGQLDEAVAVGVPDLELLGQALEEAAGLLQGEHAVAVFAVGALGDAAAEEVALELDAVADAEDGHAELEDGAIGHGRVLGEDAARAAGEDDADDAVGLQLRDRGGEVVDLGQHLALADATRDDLRVLGTEIKDGDGLGHEAKGRAKG